METDNIKELSLSIDTLTGTQIVDKLNEIFINCHAVISDNRIKVTSRYFNDLIFIKKLIKGGVIHNQGNKHYALYSNKVF